MIGVAAVACVAIGGATMMALYAPSLPHGSGGELLDTGRKQIADGLACRRPSQDALDIIFAHVPRIVEVSESEIADAMCIYHQDTHNIAEGAGAAALAAALKEKSSLRGKRAGIILTGGNVDRELYVAVLTGAFQTGAFQTGASQNRPLQSETLHAARPA